MDNNRKEIWTNHIDGYSALTTLDAQSSKLFVAVKEGNLSKVKSCIAGGCDINKKSFDDKTLIHEAAHWGNEAIVVALLKYGADVEARTKEEGNLAIHIAAGRGHRQIVKLFIEKGVDIDVCNNDGRTPLFEASFWGQSGAAEYLLSKGADVNTRTRTEGLLPIHVAAGRGHDKIVKLLLANRSDINATDFNNRTPLFEASLSGHDSVVRLLTQAGADTNVREKKEGKMAIHVAAFEGFRSIVRHFLDQGVDVNVGDEDNRTPLYEASYSGKESIVKLLICKGANIHTKTISKGWLAVHASAAMGHEAVVQIFLDNNLDINIENYDGRTPLFEALYNGQESVVKLLINRGSKIDTRTKEGWSPIHAAAARGHENIVKLFLDNGIDINASNYDGRTPLFEASYRGQEEVVKYLIGEGADIHKRTKTEGLMAIHAAAAKGHSAVIDVLLNSGVDLNARNNDDRTPLFEAARSGQTDVVKFLIEKGADIKLKTKESGWNALHAAASEGHTEIVEMLIEAGGNVNARSLEYKTPLYEAVRCGHYGTCKVLLQHGANKYAKTRAGESISGLAKAKANGDILNLFSN